jgi:hypothetical protein
MPILIAAGFSEKTRTPLMWQCSECRRMFSIEQVTDAPPPADLRRVDTDFRTHCKEEHPGVKAIGLQGLSRK